MTLLLVLLVTLTVLEVPPAAATDQEVMLTAKVGVVVPLTEMESP